MSVRIYQRRGTSAEWSSANTILSDGEIGYDSTVKQYKIGDGLTAWNSLPYNNAEYKTITANYTIQADDFGSTILVDSANPVVITVPQNTTESLPLGFNVKVLKVGNGAVSVQSEKETVPMTWDWDWHRDHYNRLAGWEWTQDIAAGDGKFLILGYYGTLSVSDDGKDFQNIIAPISSYWGAGGFHVNYGNGSWVIGPYYAAEGFAYVSKDLKKWDIVETSAPRAWNGSYGGAFLNGKFIIGHSDGVITTSTDGYSWTSAISPVQSLSAKPTYGNVNGEMQYLFQNNYGSYVPGVGSVQMHIVSTDAITWTTALPFGPTGFQTLGLGNSVGAGPMYNNGKWLLPLRENGNNIFFTSTDTITWTTINFGTEQDPVLSPFGGSVTGFRNYNYADGTWVISGYAENLGPSWNNGSYSWLPANITYLSTDLITWNSLPQVSPGYIADWAGGIAYENNTWVIGGYYNNNIAFYKPETNVDAVEIHNAGSLNLSKNSYVTLEKIGTDKWFAESTSGLNTIEKLPIKGGEFNTIDMSKISSGQSYSIEPLSQVKHVMIPLNDTSPVGTEIEIVNSGDGLLRVLGEFDTSFLEEWNAVDQSYVNLQAIFGYMNYPKIVYGDGTFYYAVQNSNIVAKSQDLINWTTAGTNINNVTNMLWNDAYKMLVTNTQNGLSYSIDRGNTWTTAIIYYSNEDDSSLASWTSVLNGSFNSQFFNTDGHNTYIAGWWSYQSKGTVQRLEYHPQDRKANFATGWYSDIEPYWTYSVRPAINGTYTGAYSPVYGNGTWIVGGYYGQAAISKDSGKTWHSALSSQGSYQGGASGAYSYLGYNSFANKAYGQLGLGGSYGEMITSTDGYTWYVGGGYLQYQFNEEKQWVAESGSYYYGQPVEGPQGFTIHPFWSNRVSKDLPYSYDGTKQMSIGQYPVFKYDGQVTQFGNMGGNNLSDRVVYGNNKFIMLNTNGQVWQTEVGDYVKIIAPGNGSNVRYTSSKSQILPAIMNGNTSIEQSNNWEYSFSPDLSNEQSNLNNSVGAQHKSTIKPHGKATIVKTDINTWKILGDLQ